MDPFFSILKEKYVNLEEVMTFLEEVKKDILENLSDLISDSEKEEPQLPFSIPGLKEDPTDRYKVNLIVDNSKLEGAPVIMELNPNHSRLFGGTEKEARFGALITDYTMIIPGSAHRANGGFLVVPVEGLFTNLLVWDSLKRAISNEKLEIEEVTESLGFMVTKSLRPDPIAFDAKVIIVGAPQIYNLLYAMDRDFKQLFKVKADFDTTMERNEENVNRYASFICTLCKKENLIHLDQTGAAVVVEYSSRLAEDQSKLSTRFAEVADIIREACFYAEEEGADHISKKHVEMALEERVYRSNLIQKKIEEMINRGFLLIDTEGEKVGHGQRSHGQRWDRRYRERGRDGWPNPYEGRSNPEWLPQRKICKEKTSQPLRQARVRAELQRRRGRQRLQHRTLRHPIGPIGETYQTIPCCDGVG